MKRLLLLIAVLSVVGLAHAQMVSQTITITNGWNAFYLEVTPEGNDAACSNFFANLPVKNAGGYVPDAYDDTAQYRSDGTRINGKPVSYRVWIRDNRAASTLSSMVGGCVYTCFAAGGATFTVAGRPEVPCFYWRTAAMADGLYNLAAPVLDDGKTKAVLTYFQEGPYGKKGYAYQIGGTNESGASFFKVANSKLVKRGDVLAMSGTKDADWPGVLRVMPDSPEGVAFGTNSATAGFSVANVGTTSRVVRISYIASERATDVKPALKQYVPMTATNVAAWVDFDTAEKTLAVGETWAVQLSIDRAQLTQGSVYGALIKVADASGPTGMRVLLPVSAEWAEASDNNHGWPRGLWVGKVTLSQVSSSASLTPVAAGGKIEARVILHVDSNNTVRLLQRVLAATETTNANSRTRFFATEEAVPSTLTARRISSLILDTANREVKAAASNADGTAGAFGAHTTFNFTVGERSKENPFRHAWHPDHDGKNATYSGLAPSGDNPANYIGSIKPETFSVTNKIEFLWYDAAGNSTFSWNPEQGAYGRCDWTLTGLRVGMPVIMRGVFILKRVSPNAELEY